MYNICSNIYINEKTIDEFIKHRFNTYIKNHITKTIKVFENVVFNNEISMIHKKGFVSNNEYLFIKNILLSKYQWSYLYFIVWYYIIKCLLKNNLYTTTVYDENNILYAIFIEYTYNKKHYFILSVIDDNYMHITGLYILKYIDIIMYCINNNIKILCLGYKTNLFKSGLINNEKSNYNINIVDLFIRFLSNT